MGNGEKFGVKYFLPSTRKSDFIPSAIYLAKSFANGEDIWVSLGDNFIFGSRIKELYEKANNTNKATIFIKHVGNISGLGSAKVGDGKIQNLKEKPKSSKPGWAVTGLYKFPNTVFEFFQQLNLPKEMKQK